MQAATQFVKVDPVDHGSQKLTSWPTCFEVRFTAPTFEVCFTGLPTCDSKQHDESVPGENVQRVYKPVIDNLKLKTEEDPMKRTIMIIENERKAANIIRDILHQSGFRSIAVHYDSMSAYRDIVHSGLPDLVVINADMPDIDGVTLLEQISLVYKKTVAGIILTGDSKKVAARTSKYPILEKAAPGIFKMLEETILDMLSRV